MERGGGAGVVAGPKHFGTAAKAEIIKFAHRAESHTKLPMSKTHFKKYFPLLFQLIFNPSSPPRCLVQELNVPDGKASLVQLLALIHNTKISNDFNGMIAKRTATYCICCLTVLNRGKGEGHEGGNANLGRLNIPMQPRRGARSSSCSCVRVWWQCGSLGELNSCMTN